METDTDKYLPIEASLHTFIRMDTKRKAGYALCTFCQEFGVPNKFIFGGSKDQGQRKTKFMKKIRKNDIDFHVIEPDRHNHNPCKEVIREV